MHKVKNAIIMAAGTSSRFAPLSYETHKGLIMVREEVLVERQIRQLREAGIEQIIIVTGYKAEQFKYLRDKFGVILVHNEDYLTRNNNSSIQVAREYLGDSYVCSVDNYFNENPFENEVEDSYYSAVYTEGKTAEWCMTEDKYGFVDSVTIGGENSWYMLGHTFWTKEFSQNFLKIMDEIYEKPETANLLWESIYSKNLNVLKMKIKKYANNVIFEFDTLDELREFDNSYIEDTRSEIIRTLAHQLGIAQKDMTNFATIKEGTNEAVGVSFEVGDCNYEYYYTSGKLKRRK